MPTMTGLAFILAATSFPGEPVSLPSPHVELAVGYRVINRHLERVDADNAFLDGETLVAWSAVAGVPAGFVEHVWIRDGIEVARHYLPVGSGRRWRTWSQEKVLPGTYQIQVIGPDGSSLAKRTFVVEAYDDIDDDMGC